MSEELTENTPLISNEEIINQVRVTEEQKRQLRVIYLIYFLSTISTSIFTSVTYIFYFFVREEGKRIEPSFRVPNSFIIGQILLSLVWGYYSDKSGRKRILNICLLGSALTMFLFGFCNSTGYATFISFLAGAFSCIYSVIQAIFGESTNKSNRPISFIFLCIITIIAFYIGNSISVPSNQAKFPFLIPCLIASIINIITFNLSHLYLRETLGNNAYLEENNTANSSINHSNTLVEFELYTILGLRISKDSVLVLTGLSLISFIFDGFWNIFISWSSNKVSNGGLNLKTNQIFKYLMVSPIIILVTLILYFSIHKRLGSLKIYKIFFLPTAVVFILSSTITLVARTGNVPAVLTLLIFVVYSLYMFYYFQYISLNLLLIESSESTGNLGILFGISSALTGTINLISPNLFYLTYKFSTEGGLPFPLNHSLVWIILTIMALIGYWSSSKIKNL